MNNNEILPIGSVVLLKGHQKRVMVTGYCAKTKEEKIYDYFGCLFPEGILESSKSILFNEEEIEKIDYIGYVTEEAKKILEEVKKIKDNL